LEQLLKTLTLVNILEVKKVLEILAIILEIQRLSDSQVFLGNLPVLIGGRGSTGAKVLCYKSEGR